MDTIYKTQFAELGFTHVTGTQVGAGDRRQISEWRFVDLTAEKPPPIGASYPSRALLMADLPRYAFEYGCDGAPAPRLGNLIEPQWKDAVFTAWLRNDQEELSRLREMIEPHLVHDVCITGNPALNGKCGDPDCVCS
jgi:hypothetical protein